MEKMVERMLREMFKNILSNIPSGSDEAFGKFVIKVFFNFIRGLKALKNDFKGKKVKCKKLLIMLGIAFVVFITLTVVARAKGITSIYVVYAVAFAAALIPVIYIIRTGAKNTNKKVEYSKMLQRVGLLEGISNVKDSRGKYKNVKATPEVLSVKTINNFTTYTFRTNIVLDEWLKAKDKMKSVFNSEVLNIRYAEKSYNRVIVEMATIGTDKLPSNVLWKDEYYKRGKVTIGMGANNKIIRLDITKSDTVHALIAGQTGAGKSVVSEKILNDCCRNGYHVEIIDRKGGLDYIGYEVAGVKVATTLDNTLIMTTNAVKELDARLKLFRKAKVRKLEDYNKVAKTKLVRYVIFIDEAAEVFSSITEKKKVAAIKENVTSIVRRGRALGMNVILATQKCSALVITTEIRSLLGTQICSYVNTTSDSRQILDHGYAASLPKIPGRFTRKIPRTSDGFEDFQVFKLTGDEDIIYSPEDSLAVPEPQAFIEDKDDTDSVKPMIKKVNKVMENLRNVENEDSEEDKN